MLDYLVLYQSESGNTKKIAASIFSRLPGNSKDLIDIDTDKTIPEANVYFIGFCVHRGSCSMEVSDFLSDLSGKQIAYSELAEWGIPRNIIRILPDASVPGSKQTTIILDILSVRERCRRRYV